jgi:hypothetical protein
MKKTLLISLILVLLALGVFTGVAGAQVVQQGTGSLHEYMEKALAEKLGLPVADVEAYLDAGKTIYQFALDNGVAQEEVAAFIQEIRTSAINAALADGVITEAQAAWMLQVRGFGAGAGQGHGMRRDQGAGSGVNLCDGTGDPIGTGMQHRGGWQQVNP